MTRRINSASRSKLEAWEDCVLYAYDDADPGRVKKFIEHGDWVNGTLTIGFGHTGPDVKKGMRITQDEAHALLTLDLAPCEKAVDTLVKVHLNDCQFAALVIFCLNVGTGKKGFAGSTLLKRLNKGEYDAVPYELLKWTKTTINGKKVQSKGLVNRRNKEIGLWSAGPSTVAAPSSVSAQPIKKPIITKESVASTVVAASGAATAADRLGLVDMFSGTGPVQYALAGILVVCFAALAYWFLKKRV